MSDLSPTAATPVCPRHPDRESWVRCQRCGQPVCPQCQRPAAVGVQCVDCVAAGARTVRHPRTMLGGRPAGRPAVTYTMIGLCAAVYIGQRFDPRVTDLIGFAPAYAWHEPWRALTSAFLHAPDMPFHILVNMVVLWQIGPYLESLLGRVRYAALYLLSALGGSVAVLLLAPAPHQLLRSSAAWEPYLPWVTGVVGASGAVFGLFGAILVVNRHLGRTTAGLVATVAINAAIGFIYPGISWQGHLGGFVAGAVVALLFVRLREQPARRWQPLALALFTAALVAVSVVKLLPVPDLYR
jgi:membrane associated rhomboid family serine protease